MPESTEKNIRHSSEPGRAAAAAVPQPSATSNGAYAAANGNAGYESEPISTGVSYAATGACPKPWKPNAAASISASKTRPAGQSDGNAATNAERTADTEHATTSTPEPGPATIDSPGTATNHAISRQHGPKRNSRADG